MTDNERKEIHLKTITTHIEIVQDLCNKMGLNVQHDASKFDEEEFEIYHWANGSRSPHDIARQELGYSPSWVHHKAKNKHHWEYWVDFNHARPNGDGTFTIICVPVKMPYQYVIETVCDFVGAGKAYEKEAWTKATPINYWNNRCEGTRAMHADSEYLLKYLLNKINELGLDEFIVWYNSNKIKIEAAYNAGTIRERK